MPLPSDRPLAGSSPSEGPGPATFVALADSSIDFVLLASLEGEILYANASAGRMLAFGEAAQPATFDELFEVEDRPYAREVILGTRGREGYWTGDYRLRTGGPAPLAVHLNVFNVYERGGGEVCAMALTGHGIGSRRHAEQRLRTLIESGPALSHSLDYAQTLRNLAELVVRTLATFCEIDVFTSSAAAERPIERVVAWHVDRSRQPEVDALGAFVPDSSVTAHPVARVFEAGASLLVETIDDAWLSGATVSPEHAAALRRLDVSSLLCVPLVASGKTLGALTCYIAKEERVRSTRPGTYDAEDLFFLEEIGRRAGIAIDNALSFGHERLIAASLQTASLPEELPSAAGVRLSAFYRPGSQEATIGGDWYDAFGLEDGTFVYTIGDVVGHGLRAGIIMTKLRQAMQAAAMVDSDPNVMLAVADRTVRMLDREGFATSLAARYDPRRREITFASAGHPGPLLRHADGRIDDLTTTGLLLGMRYGKSSATSTVPIPDGAMLVFYTDGLVEATRDFAKGQRRLLESLGRAELPSAPNPARALVTGVLRGKEAGDDIAVLVVAFDHESAAKSL